MSDARIIFVPGDANRILNGGFEANDDGAIAVGSGTALSRSTDHAAEGIYGLKVELGSGVGQFGVGFSDPDTTRIVVAEGEVLTFAAQIFAEDDAVGKLMFLYVATYDGDDVIQAPATSSTVTLEAGWNYFVRSVTIPTGAGIVACEPRLLDFFGADYTFWVDDVRFLSSADLRVLQSPYPAPGNRFRGWSPDVNQIAHRSTILSTGAQVEYRFRRDYLALAEIPGLKAANLVDAIALKEWLLTGGTCIVETADSGLRSFSCRLAPDTVPAITLVDRQLMEWTFSAMLKNLLDAPMIASYS